MTFDVPPNTASITIVEQAVNAPETITYQPAGQAAQKLENTAVPYFVRDPSGTKIYDDNPSPPVSSLAPDQIANLTAFFATSAPATGTLTIPNTSGGLRLVTSGLPSGTWQLMVSDYAYECSPAFQQADGASCSGGSEGSTYDVTIVTKPLAGGAIPGSGTLDVVVYFATTLATSSSLAPLSAATANAGSDPDLNRMEDALRSLLLDSGGITVGSVTYVDLPADVQAKYATGLDVDQTGGCSAIADLFRYGVGGNTLNIFFVSSFIATGLPSGNSVVGLDGTIPGPATVGGSAGSGAAVATHDVRDPRHRCTSARDYYNCGPDETAYIIAHEAGHYLGLYHVTESDGTQFDPLLDTPMCPCATCASSPTSCSGGAYAMTLSDCNKGTTCGGGTNLMFWRLESGSLGTLSAEQQQVMRANPLVQ